MTRRGFTVAELITVIAIVGILAGVAVPMARFGYRRQKEMELRQRLRVFENAIDQYHELRMKGVIKIPPKFGQGEYPKDLEELTKPIELLDGKKILLLRKSALIDPITGRTEWRTVSSSDDVDAISSNQDNVWDVHSTSPALALDGKTHYSEW
jgi:general secretion pathway protein G